MSMPPAMMGSGGGMPPMPPPGLPPMGGPGGPSGAPPPEDAFAALQSLTPRSANPQAAMDRARQAIDMIGQLARAIESQVSQMNPEVAKLLIDIRQKSQQAKTKLMQAAPLGPPPDLMLGMTGAAPAGGGGPSIPSIPGGVGGRGF